MPLPDAVMQGLGWAPPPVDDSVAGAPPSPAFTPPPQPPPVYPAASPDQGQAAPKGLLPEIPTMAPAAPPTGASQDQGELPPIAQPPQITLPSARQPEQAAPQAPAVQPDFHVPMPAMPTAAPAQPRPVAHAAPAKPLTTQQKFDAAQARSDQATNLQLQANDKQTALNVRKADADLAAIAVADKQRQAIDAQKKVAAEERDKTLAIKQREADDARKAVDDYKVNPNKFWDDLGMGGHIGLYLAMAMSGLGAALNGKGGELNPVIQMVQAKANDAIKMQQEQREQLGKKYERSLGEMNRYEKFSADKIAQLNLQSADVDATLARDLRTNSAKLADQQARIAGEQQAAILTQSAAEKYQAAVVQATSAVTQEKQVQVAAAQAATAAGHLALDTKKFNAEEDFRKWTIAKEAQQLDLAERKQAFAERKAQATKIKEEGVFNPVTGDPLLTERGRRMVAAADQVEAQARATGDQQKAAMAQQMREEAKETEAVTIKDPTDRRKVVDATALAQSVVDEAAKIKEFLKTDPASWDRAEWGATQARFGNLVKDYIELAGANASSREFQAITEHVLTFDPSSVWQRITGKTPAIGSLDGLEEVVKGGMDKMLKSRGIKDGWVPRSPMDSKQLSLTGKTTGEEGEDARPGALGDTLNAVKAGLPIGRAQPYRSPDEIVADAENRAIGNTSSPYGLAPEDDAKIRSLAAKAGNASNAEYRNIVDALAAPLKGDKRPSLTSGVLNLLRDENPGLYSQVLLELGKTTQQEAQALDAARARMAAQAPTLPAFTPPPAPAPPWRPPGAF